MLNLNFPHDDATISLQTATQKKFVDREKERAAMDGDLTFKWYDLEREGGDCTIPLPVSFVWEETENLDKNDGWFYLLVSECPDMKSPWVYVTKENRYDVYNLKVGTTYYWCVQKNGKRSEQFTFRTLLTLPRCLKVEEISNVRDMGGYKVEEGTIRQGMVYRGGEFELHMSLSPQGMEELRRLKIRTELDMRGEATGKVDYTTAEAIGMTRVFVPSVPYGTVFEKKQRSALKDFFKVFAQPKNYPIYFHCWGGADRTGTFAFILGALLGMTYEDLIYEYEFTSLAVWGIRSRYYKEFQRFLELFMGLPGVTLRDKATIFLKSHVRLTDKQVNAIYDCMVEKNSS